jgi:two-component system NarL family sensor kinase
MPPPSQPSGPRSQPVAARARTAPRALPHFGRASWGVLCLALSILALTGVFVWLTVTGPADGVRLLSEEAVWQPDGVVVTSITEVPGGLRTGDRIIAVEGRSMVEWMQARFQLDAPQWRIGQTVTYTVLRAGRVVSIPLTLGPYPLGALVQHIWSSLLFLLAAQLVGTFVFVLRPHDSAARVLFVLTATIIGQLPWVVGLQVHDLVGGAGFWLFCGLAFGTYVLLVLTTIHFTLIFVRPAPLVVKYPWTIWAMYAATYAGYLAYLAAMWDSAASVLVWFGRWYRDTDIVTVVGLGLVCIILGWSYRRSRDALTRQKLLWVVFAFLVAAGGLLTLWTLPALLLGHPLISQNAIGWVELPFILILAVGILRAWLWDIEIIIKRTLVYGALTMTLALIYSSSVIGFQQLFRAFTGQQSAVAVVASTLAIAALFTPLRRRIQTFIDQRFYRRKYDAMQVQAAFSARIRDEVELETVTDSLLSVVAETLQPTQLTLWLRSSESTTPARTGRDATS